MFLSDLAFQAIVALIWSLVGIPFNIFNGVASSLLSANINS
jgi:hypothetical protein